jgi:aminopeptidase N
MRDATPQPIHLTDYAEPHHWVEDVHLTFHLSPGATRVVSKIQFRANPNNPGPLTLDGEKLTLLSAKIDGETVSPDLTATGLTLNVTADTFVWEAEVEIAPDANTALEGLYMSKGMFCTQCEAEGFRKITYYPDRPDVMAPFTVWINGDSPVLLSNGNLSASGPDFAEWHDPWPKPAYLFALVAGDLVSHDNSFTTMSGRDVALKIWVRPGDEDKCAYAMDALIRSMHWDETEYGREYDLDLFQIVAVDDFNMGAMENKGLNIFNSKYVLASPETATDRDFALIEGIIAHEYFHNWTGNRITCRDWFQLCLKEGLTVHRDQQFSGDMRSHAVQRIEDVLQLRARQFREDAGPLAHPVRPDHYVEINNFYTATVYEKGAEVIGMLRTLVGAEAYRKGCDLYFERHDGQACTIEQWLAVFEDATGRDLSQFKRWYTQPGTPRLSVDERYEDGTLTLSFTQTNPRAPDDSPHVIPMALGLLAADGTETHPTSVIEITEASQIVTIDGLSARPITSLNRGFSAPVLLDRETDAETRAILLAHDTDPFNRWEAGRALAKDALLATLTKGTPTPDALLNGLRAVATDDTLDPAFRALALSLPSEDDLAATLHDIGHVPDPTAIHKARNAMRADIARALHADLVTLYDTLATPGPYSPDAQATGKRALRATALSLLAEIDGPERAAEQFSGADNMTESLSALATLLSIGAGQAELAAFETRWSTDQLVLDKWFMLQVTCAKPEQTVQVTKTLTEHPQFDWKTPNRFRSVMGALTMSPAGFHAPTGDGYALLGDWLLKLDPLNPQTAARLSTAFETWRRYDADRQALMTTQLDRILGAPNLSPDLTEMATRMRGV